MLAFTCKSKLLKKHQIQQFKNGQKFLPHLIQKQIQITLSMQMKLIFRSFAVFLSIAVLVFAENEVDRKKEHLSPGPWQQHLSDAVWMKELVKEDGIYRDKLSIVTSRRSGERDLLAYTGWVKQEVRRLIRPGQRSHDREWSW